MLDLLEKGYNVKAKPKCNIGLSSAEAENRLKTHGENKLASEKKKSALKIFAGQFHDIMVIILLCATGISVLLGEVYDAITIILIVMLNAILGFIQEYRTEKTLDALSKMTSPTARVYRDDSLVIIPAEQLVVGDVFEIEAGDRVPCDGRIINSKGLFSDEAILTGEAVPVEKNANSSLRYEKKLNLSHCVYMGAVITRGVAQCEAAATGLETQMGMVSGMLDSISDEQTPLQKKLSELGKIVAIICLVVCVVVFTAGILRGEPFFTMLMTGITIAIAAIPEGLPATVTIALALAVNRMLKKNALVNKLHSVETLGCASVICSDKTGTITENKMTVSKIVTSADEFDVSGTGYKLVGDIKAKGNSINSDNYPQLLRLITASVLCNNSSVVRPTGKGVRNREIIRSKEPKIIGDPTEIALLVLGEKAGINQSKLKKTFQRVDEVPFESETRSMTVTVKNNSGEKFDFVKGAIDVLLKSCTKLDTVEGEIDLTDAHRAKFMRKNDELAEQALRVLGFAFRKYNDDGKKSELIFIGLCGMIDLPRAEAKEAIKICKQANIKTVMITGDHKTTACAVAKKAGILRDGMIALTGDELSKMSDEKLSGMIEKVAVFARVNPSDKLRIVKAFKKNGHIVAMTGDGVNDAPAVKEADIGVSMGITGTDVTKQAADVVLLDDNFATLVEAVKQGRTIYSNIRKFVRYLLSCNIGEVVTMFVGIVMGLPMVLLPTQILLVNLVTDGLPAVALGLEPTENSVMRKMPRKSDDSFFSDGLLSKIIFRGLFIGLCTLASFVAVLGTGNNVETARTAALFTLVVSQLIHVFECKSEQKSLFRINYLNNVFLVLAVVISLGVLLATIYIPALQIIFSTVALGKNEILIALICSVAVPFIAIIFNSAEKSRKKSSINLDIIAKR